jgi:hypothetical protein
VSDPPPLSTYYNVYNSCPGRRQVGRQAAFVVVVVVGFEKRPRGWELARIGKGIFSLVTPDNMSVICLTGLQPSAALHSVAIWDGMTKLMGPLASLA